MSLSRGSRRGKKARGKMVGELLSFPCHLPPFVDHKAHKLTKSLFVRDGMVLAAYEHTSAMRLFRLQGQVLRQS